MDAFIKAFNEKEFLNKFTSLRPSYLMVGTSACKALEDKDMKLPEDYYSYSGYMSKFQDTEIYLMPAPFPPDKIIFGVE